VRLLLTGSDRWEQRDAAFALMALQLDSQQLQSAAADVFAVARSATAQQQLGAAAVAAAAESAGSSSEQGNNTPAGTAAAETNCNGVVASASSSSSSDASLAAAASEHSNAAAAAAAEAGGTQPSAELLTTGLEHMHELLGRYRWCSQQYLQGQVGFWLPWLEFQNIVCRVHALLALQQSWYDSVELQITICLMTVLLLCCFMWNT
jgi:hypothetical protein